MNPLAELRNHGQSVWLDDIRRELIVGGDLYDSLAIEDVRHAAYILRPSYEESDGADGFVSIEPPPQLTRDTAATIAEAQRLWRTVDRPNLMIKVVATTKVASTFYVLLDRDETLGRSELPS